MGENFLRKQAQSFVRHMDRAHKAHIQTPNLFTSKDESVRREFTVGCGSAGQAGHEVPAVGAPLAVCAVPGEPAFILHGNRRLYGFMPEDQAYLDCVITAHPELGGMIQMQVTDTTVLGDITLSPVIDADPDYGHPITESDFEAE